MVFFSFLGGFIVQILVFWVVLFFGNPFVHRGLRQSVRRDSSYEYWEETVEESFSAMRPESSLKPAGEQKKAKKLPSGGGGTVNQTFFCALNFV